MKEKRPRGRPKVQIEYSSMHIRLPQYVFEQLSDISTDSLLSMNAIIVLALKDYFEKVAKKETK